MVKLGEDDHGLGSNDVNLARFAHRSIDDASALQDTSHTRRLRAAIDQTMTALLGMKGSLPLSRPFRNRPYAPLAVPCLPR